MITDCITMTAFWTLRTPALTSYSVKLLTVFWRLFQSMVVSVRVLRPRGWRSRLGRCAWRWTAARLLQASDMLQPGAGGGGCLEGGRDILGGPWDRMWRGREWAAPSAQWGRREEASGRTVMMRTFGLFSIHHNYHLHVETTYTSSIPPRRRSCTACKLIDMGRY